MSDNEEKLVVRVLKPKKRKGRPKVTVVKRQDILSRSSDDGEEIDVDSPDARRRKRRQRQGESSSAPVDGDQSAEQKKLDEEGKYKLNKEEEHNKQEDGHNYKMLVQHQEVLARRIKHLEEMLKESESLRASSASVRVDFSRDDNNIMDTSAPTSASSSGPISALAHPPSSETDADSKQIKTPGDLPKWYRKDNRMKAFDFIDVFEMCMISANIGKKHWPQQLLSAVQDVNHKRWVREKLVDPSVMDVYFTWEIDKITFIDYFTTTDQLEDLRELYNKCRQDVREAALDYGACLP